MQSSTEKDSLFESQGSQPELMNGRYKKIGQIGDGAFNIVYCAQDMAPPETANRLLAPKHIDMIANLPQNNTNPYKNKTQSYFDEYEDDLPKKEEADPAVLAELSNYEVLLPENSKFFGQKLDHPGRYVAIKKQKNVIGLEGIALSLLREIRLL